MANEVLQYLVTRLIQERAAEEEARKCRIKIEDRIASLIPGPERGQKTAALEDGTKIIVERGFNYKADCAKIEDIFHTEGETRFAPVKTKTTRELDEKGYEYYRENDVETFALLSQYVTVTPKKVFISLKAAK